MKNLTFTLIIIFSFFTNPVWSQIEFLGFEQTQCTTAKNYAAEEYYCASHSWGYNLLKGSVTKYTSTCGNDIGEGYNASDLKFINDSTGFLLEDHSFQGISYDLSIKRTTNYGVSWKKIMSSLNSYGTSSDINYFVLNQDAVVCLIAPVYSNPDNGLIVIDGKKYSVNNDTILRLTKYGEPECVNDTLSFNVKWNDDTVNYKIVFDYVSSEEETQIKADFNIYPNPTEDIIHFELNDKINLLELYDLSGQKLRIFQNIEDNQVDISNIKSGVYILQVVCNNDKWTTKIIKE